MQQGALGMGGKWGLTCSLQLDAAPLPAALPIQAHSLNLVDGSHKGLNGHLDLAGLTWLQQPLCGQNLEWAGDLPVEEGG